MTTPHAPTVSSRASRVPGALCALGGLAFVVLALVQFGAGPGPRPGVVDPWMAIAFLALVLTGVGVVAAARVGNTGRSVLGRAGLGIALVGLAIFTVAHLVATFVSGQEQSLLFPIGQVLEAAGMVMLGTAVLRQNRWTGIGRWTPLLCGLYPLVILIPAFAIFGDPNYPAIAGFGVCWALLGVALAMATVRHEVAA